MSTAESIDELINTLPEEEASLVLEFVEFVRQCAQTKIKRQATAKAGRFHTISINAKGFKSNRD